MSAAPQIQADAAAAAPSRTVGHFQLGECIGRGASAAVFRGLNLLTGETVAVKQLRQEGMASQADQIALEIDLLKQLRHPNIVALHGFEESGQHLYIFMELCENGSLQETIRKFGKVPEQLVAIYMGQVLRGLAYLHGQGVIHRDIKSAVCRRCAFHKRIVVISQHCFCCRIS
nr:hypothetical protein HK105_003516 [Polyrhizophydium stewartii]